MNADANPIEYWTPDVPRPPLPAGQGQVASVFTGPERVGCVTMLTVVLIASGLALGIVTALAWVLA
jgi:hypothetical protein